MNFAGIHFTRISRALNVIRNMKKLDRFLNQSDVNVFAKIFEAGDAHRIAIYLADVLRPIDEGAQKQKGQLKQTLLCYFDSQHNIKQAAESLGIHINTMRQRLDTLREVTGGWDDPIKALELHLALRLSALTD